MLVCWHSRTTVISPSCKLIIGAHYTDPRSKDFEVKQFLRVLLEMKNVSLCVTLMNSKAVFFKPTKMPVKLYFYNFLNVSAANSTLNDKDEIRPK